MTATAVDRSWKIAPEVSESKMIDGYVLMHRPSGEYFGLDPIGAGVWDTLKSGGSMVEFIEVQSAESEIAPDRLRGDVDALLADMADCQLIEPADA